ncbi:MULTISPECIES: hypothetical protein [Alteromonas]|jgi:hypothetical protein|uniref:hypothetical protein n=1 Tax=Alteromonas TaxID=226 RepID=UPI00076FE23B|nr:MULTISPECIES: hypothetical protein [Alteromonas]AMJ86156.1 hypothetical protein AV939_05905 [Alteromonas sp. Mac1]AMJ90015.1 hypothetical protein AV940_05750 [Alteromonas sp. Mac2]ANB22554.1 hypothetical protein A6K25_15535 [Alteromonas stellipolaris]
MEANNIRGEERRKISPDDHHKYLERKSGFRIDFRQRIDLFTKTVLLFTGGALTISMSLFLKQDSPQVTTSILQDLKISWGLLLFTIVAFSVCYYTLLIQGFYINKNWDGRLPLSDDQITGNTTLSALRGLIVILGTIGFFSFLWGLVLLGTVSIEVVELAGS